MRWAWVAVLMLASPAWAESPVRVEEVIRRQPPMHLHIATIDLNDASVSVRLVRATLPTTRPSAWACALQLPSEVANREGFQVAVNGDLFYTKDSFALLGRRTPYFVGNAANVCGWAMSDGDVWAHSVSAASLIVLRDGSVRIGKFDPLPTESLQAVSGSELIEAGGRNVASVGGKSSQAYPRTAAGIDATGRKLVLVVVDGHRPEYSAGMTLRELSEEMIRLGCLDAINLDGGGSSVMVTRENEGEAKVISRPSDGYDLPVALSLQRPVANVLGVRCATRPVK